MNMSHRIFYATKTFEISKGDGYKYISNEDGTRVAVWLGNFKWDEINHIIEVYENIEGDNEPK